jgi:hypothetical protein
VPGLGEDEVRRVSVLVGDVPEEAWDEIADEAACPFAAAEWQDELITQGECYDEAFIKCVFPQGRVFNWGLSMLRQIRNESPRVTGIQMYLAEPWEIFELSTHKQKSTNQNRILHKPRAMFPGQDKAECSSQPNEFRSFIEVIVGGMGLLGPGKVRQGNANASPCPT